MKTLIAQLLERVVKLECMIEPLLDEYKKQQIAQDKYIQHELNKKDREINELKEKVRQYETTTTN